MLMLKKLIFSTLFTATLFLLSVHSVSAMNKSLITDPSVGQTKSVFATITRPQGVSETTYKPLYMICGVNFGSGVRFETYILQEEADRYQALELQRGGNAWEMVAPSVFAEQVVLPNNGVNRLRVAAYDIDATQLKHGENLQINDFVVTLMQKEEKGFAATGFRRITGMLSHIFKSS